jgi:hypothetical protein
MVLDVEQRSMGQDAGKTVAALNDIAKLYDLVAAMNEIVARLRHMSVEVKFGGVVSHSDPLESKAAIRIILNHVAGSLRD